MAYIGIDLGDRWSRYLMGPSGAQLHLTLAHFEKPSPAQAAELALDLGKLAETVPVQVLYLDSIETFSVGDVLIIKNTNDLHLLRSQVVGLLMKHRLQWSRDHEWRPHVTIGKANPDHAELIAQRVFIECNQLELCGTPIFGRYTWSCG